jgi:hypothetical protein
MSERELGGVGEGLWVIDSAQPLTAATSDQRSQVSLPLPKERGFVVVTAPHLHSPSPHRCDWRHADFD